MSKNILDLGSIPDGTLVCNIEKILVTVEKLIKAAGTSAIVFSHSVDSVKVKFPSGMILNMNLKCRTMIGVAAGVENQKNRSLKPVIKLNICNLEEDYTQL
ncbi:MAG: hypothetical protein P0116_04145 [Candidatus Nitrosocosmicus sp.]|nr:hypothetical protein [Candidatus Nitrosocosmicus sp.]